jgi:hypothetical protein
MVGKSDALITSVRLSATAPTNRAAEPAVFIFKPDDRRVTLQSFVNLSTELDLIEVVANLHPCLSTREFKLNFYHTPPMGEPRKLAYERMSTSSRVVYRLKIPHTRAAEPAVFIFKPDDRRVTLESFVHLSAELDLIEVVVNLHPCLSNREFKLNFYHTPPVGEPRKLAYERMSTSSRVVYRLKIPHTRAAEPAVFIFKPDDRRVTLQSFVNLRRARPHRGCRQLAPVLEQSRVQAELLPHAADG